MLLCFTLPGAPAAALKLLYDWQTLIAGLLALVAAWIAGSYVQQQIEQADQHERQKLARQARAARAVSPLTLSRLTAWLRRYGRAVGALLPYDSQPNNVLAAAPGQFAFEELPPQDTGSLRELVEVGPSGVSAQVSELLREVQLITARVGELSDQVAGGRGDEVGITGLHSYALQIARAHAIVGRLFDYARGLAADVQETEPAASEIFTGLSLACGLHREDQRQLFRFAHRRTVQKGGEDDLRPDQRDA